MIFTRRVGREASAWFTALVLLAIWLVFLVLDWKTTLYQTAVVLFALSVIEIAEIVYKRWSGRRTYPYAWSCPKTGCSFIVQASWRPALDILRAAHEEYHTKEKTP